MRTNIDIDDGLMREALRLTGLKTKKEVVGQGLRVLVDLAKQASIRSLRGRLHWEGSLSALRRD
jgi:Arc/MetJ family transcription regulator